MALITEYQDNVIIGFDSEVKRRVRASSSFDSIVVPQPITKTPDTKVSPAYTYHNSNNIIKDICFSEDGKYLAVMTSCKQLCVYTVESFAFLYQHQLPRAASKIRFSSDSQYILVADKTGDALIYHTNKSEDNGSKILSHLSLLLDILMTKDNKYVISCDRDEKIKVSHYPRTYNIQSYCLGHKEFITAIDFLPHNNDYLISASGDGTIKVWLYMEGKEISSIDVSGQVVDADVMKKFEELTKHEDVDADSLPISYMSCCKLTDNTSLLAVSLYLYKGIFIYKISENGSQIRFDILHDLKLESYPSSFTINADNLRLCLLNNDVILYQLWDIKGLDAIVLSSETIDRQFSTEKNNSNEAIISDILVLYKKKIDNLQEYQERKKLRLGQSK